MTDSKRLSKTNKTFKQHLVEELSCSFCLAVLNEPVMTQCAHLFCKACIMNYLKKNNRCPTCKSTINKNTTKPVPNILNNILNKLKKINDKVSPYDQIVELNYPIETVNLVEQIKKNAKDDQTNVRASSQVTINFFSNLNSNVNSTNLNINSPQTRTNRTSISSQNSATTFQSGESFSFLNSINSTSFSAINTRSAQQIPKATYTFRSTTMQSHQNSIDNSTFSNLFENALTPATNFMINPVRINPVRIQANINVNSSVNIINTRSQNSNTESISTRTVNIRPPIFTGSTVIGSIITESSVDSRLENTRSPIFTRSKNVSSSSSNETSEHNSTSANNINESTQATGSSNQSKNAQIKTYSKMNPKISKNVFSNSNNNSIAKSNANRLSTSDQLANTTNVVRPNKRRRTIESTTEGRPSTSSNTENSTQNQTSQNGTENGTENSTENDSENNAKNTNQTSSNPSTTTDKKTDSTIDENSNVIKKSLKQTFLEELACPICLSVMVDPMMTPCNHLYCKKCILTWLKMDDKTCPICKKYVLTSNVKSAPRALKKIILKLNALPDIDMLADPPKKKTKTEVICIDLDPVRRLIPKPKKSTENIPVILLN